MRGIASITLPFPAIAAFAAFGCTHASHSPTASTRLPLTSCHLVSKATGTSVDAMCGTLDVPEDRDTNQGKTISLRVAVIPATSHTVAKDPVFILAGGPGQAVTELYPAIEGAWTRLNIAHDIVLVDQRGSGGSAPLLCSIDAGGELSLDIEDGARKSRACAETIGPRAAFYNTPAFADDLDDVRSALGYETIDLYGVSYGTGAAIVYESRHPAHVRSIVLDSVMSQTTPHAETTARDAQEALNALFAECASDTACKKAFPDPAKDLATVEAKLGEGQDFTIDHPLTEKPVTVKMTRALLGQALFVLSYEKEYSALIPLFLHDAAETGDLRKLARALLIVSGEMSIAFPLHMAVMCAEQVPLLDLAKATGIATGTFLGDHDAREYIENCRAWPKHPMHLGSAPLVAPTLLLSGDLDPVTPKSNAEAMLSKMPNSKLVVAHGYGHGVFGSGCVRKLIEKFIETGSKDNLDTTCLDELHDVRFFTSFAGTEP